MSHTKLGMLALAHSDQPDNKEKIERYSNLMHEMCMRYKVENPAELSCSTGLQFHQELSRRWTLSEGNHA